jgi:hypothetical protein
MGHRERLIDGPAEIAQSAGGPQTIPSQLRFDTAWARHGAESPRLVRFGARRRDLGRLTR